MPLSETSARFKYRMDTHTHITRVHTHTHTHTTHHAKEKKEWFHVQSSKVAKKAEGDNNQAECGH